MVTDNCLRAMDQFGGGFVRQLAILYRTADTDNQFILFCAFGAIFNKYASLGERYIAPNASTFVE